VHRLGRIGVHRLAGCASGVTLPRDHLISADGAAKKIPITESATATVVDQIARGLQFKNCTICPGTPIHELHNLSGDCNS
jgi:hypothetical protein